jgi:hypothetical protein
MNSTARRFGVAALAGLVVFAALAAPARAQRRMTTITTTPAPVINPFIQNRFVPFIPSVAAQSINPNPYLTPSSTLGQYAYNTAVLGQALSNIPPYFLGYNPYVGPTLATTGAYNPYLGGGYGGATLTTSPYSGYGYGGAGGYGSSGYGGSSQLYAQNPYNGYLRGAADVTTANANYQMITQQARLVREQVNQKHLETRRKIIEEAEWERGRMPNPDKLREADLETALNRARRDPPLTEVWSARSLNSLLNHLAAEQGRGTKGPSVPLDPEVLQSINLTPADSRANAGLLKDGGKLQWPPSLQAAELNDNRTRLSRTMEEAFQKLKFNPNAPVPPGLVKDMQTDLGRLSEQLNDSVGDLSPSQYIEAKRYLNQVGNAVAALSDPKVGAYFNPNQNWAQQAKISNVAELVKHLSRSGLRFAAATPGDEPAYNALYRALSDFDAGMRQMAKSSP